jgi:hypothetical protein
LEVEAAQTPRVIAFVKMANATGNSGLSHFWRNNDLPNWPWSGPNHFDETLDSPAVFDDVTLIHDSFGFLNVLARQEHSSLVSHFRAAWAAPWRQPDAPWGFAC